MPIKLLKPLEKVFPHHLSNLAKMIETDGIIKIPLIADKKTGIVLDGSHRYVHFLGKGYAELPVLFVDYQDENIRVGTHLMHRHIIMGGPGISKREVIERGLTGNLFPPRITRHFFPFRKNVYAMIPLNRLKKGDNVDVSHLIADLPIEKEIQHNVRYLKEIEFEIDEIIRYLEEIRQTKIYLSLQIKEMEKK